MVELMVRSGFQQTNSSRSYGLTQVFVFHELLHVRHGTSSFTNDTGANFSLLKMDLVDFDVCGMRMIDVIFSVISD